VTGVNRFQRSIEGDGAWGNTPVFVRMVADAALQAMVPHGMVFFGQG